MQFTDQMHAEDAKEDNMHKEERMMHRNATPLRHGKVRGFLGRVWRALRDSRGLINTTDLLVAAGATVILAAGVGAASIDNLNQAKYGKAQPDAVSLATAATSFYKDTGKWPGQADHVGTTGNAGTTDALFLVSTLVDDTSLPSPVTGSLTVDTAECKNNSLEGFVGSTITGKLVSTATLKNLNDFLLRKPSDVYPNWKGPYIQGEIKTDPWDKAWVLNLMPLYCSETVDSTTANTSGKLGYAWILSGGTNRTVSTAFTSAFLDPAGDDAGMNMGKLVTRGTGGADK